MTDWALESQLAYEDIKADGFSIIIRRPGSPGTFNASTHAWVNPTADSDSPSFAIISSYKAKEFKGTVIQQGDALLIIPAYGLLEEISTSHRIIINSVAWEVINTSPVAPGNVTVLYFVLIRK